MTDVSEEGFPTRGSFHSRISEFQGKWVTDWQTKIVGILAF